MDYDNSIYMATQMQTTVCKIQALEATAQVMGEKTKATSFWDMSLNRLGRWERWNTGRSCCPSVSSVPLASLFVPSFNVGITTYGYSI